MSALPCADQTCAGLYRFSTLQSVYGTNDRACKRSAYSALLHLSVRRAGGTLPPPHAGTPHHRTTGRMLERGPQSPIRPLLRVPACGSESPSAEGHCVQTRIHARALACSSDR
ncbi:hypothetical protein FOMPIDRAFT_1025285 [Fomitopsis schrenkii]|uniref:Uncharacterized protein n=1 Tax=Fomitopsis schrenkii TaxID=2126942 RepID=S8DVY7_FOMSC|nr:hypothetical protein FOMPIDRAFT_1025285 [Fomitopsis schrenkii]